MSYDRRISEADLPQRAVAIYLYLKDRANKDGTCYPAIGTIARELSLSDSTVKRAISDLEENGFIRKNSDGEKMEAGAVCFLKFYRMHQGDTV